MVVGIWHSQTSLGVIAKKKVSHTKAQRRKVTEDFKDLLLGALNEFHFGVMIFREVFLCQIVKAFYVVDSLYGYKHSPYGLNY